jgi:hypothetical protein
VRRIKRRSPREPTDTAGYDTAWAVEIAERLRQIDAGELATVPWTEARKRIVS